MSWKEDKSGLRGLFESRLISLRTLFLLGFAALSVRLLYMQLGRGYHYALASQENRVQTLFEPAPRGFFLDRKGEAIVNSQPDLFLFFAPEAHDSLERERVQAHLDRLLPAPRDIGAGFKAGLLTRNLSRAEAIRILESRPSLPGLRIGLNPRRRYLWGKLASHVLGYVGRISRSEYGVRSLEGYGLKDTLGKSGLESFYDSILRGTPGASLIEVDARGRQVRFLDEKRPESGSHLVLTLDRTIQEAAERALAGTRGAAVVVDPNSGAILALASSPGYDPNLFSSSLPLSPEMKERLFSEKGSRPLWDRAIQAQYAPGSIFKIITALSGLEEGVIKPDEKIHCPGFIEVGNPPRTFRCWQRQGHGEMDLSGALINSCDVYFYEVGKRLGATKLKAAAIRFGLGAPTEIDLTSEEKGFVPDPQWKKDHPNIQEAWYEGDTVNMSVGQGYLWVTPLQMACMTAAVANGGTLFRPTLVSEVVDSRGATRRPFAPEVLQRHPMDPEHLQWVHLALEAAVARGTGHLARLSGLRVAGKTGTAQNPQGKDHAWFVAFAPVEKPRVALAVCVEHGGTGGAVAAPIARKILKAAFPEAEELPSPSRLPASATATVEIGD